MFCKVCGKPSGYFPLCKDCNELKEQGKIIKCDKCNNWHYIDSDCHKDVQNELNCIICGNNTKNEALCSECSQKMKEYYSTSFDKNDKSFELIDYYYNLRQNIYRMKNFDYVKNNCCKLFALAKLVKDVFNNTSLSDRIINDIKDIVSVKGSKIQQSITEASNTKDSRKEEIFRTSDGHYVKSHPECIIDDILYELRIVHCYEKTVPFEMEQASVKCDWFIPVLDNRRGIYIEYWGMNTKEYLSNKARKRKAYIDKKIPLIEIEKDDYLDKQGLSDRLIQQINKAAKDYFNINDFIKLI